MELEMELVTALEQMEGLTGRICPVADIRKNSGPLVVYEPRAESRERCLTGVNGLWQSEFQVHVLHDTYGAMFALASKTRETLQGMEGMKKTPLLVEAVEVELGSPDLFEAKVSLFRRTYFVKFLYQFEED